MCDSLRIIGISRDIAELTEVELRDLAEDLVSHYRGHAMDLEAYISEYRGTRIDNLVRVVTKNG